MLVTVDNQEYCIYGKVFTETGYNCATLKLNPTFTTYESVLNELFNEPNVVIQTDKGYFQITENWVHIHDNAMQTRYPELINGDRVVKAEVSRFRPRKFGEYNMSDFPTLKRFESDLIRIMPLSQLRCDGMLVLIHLPGPVNKDLSRNFKLHKLLS